MSKSVGSASEQKASKARVARAEVPIEETLEQRTRTFRLQAGDRSSPYAAVRGLVRCDLEGAPGVRLQAVCDPRIPVDCGEEGAEFMTAILARGAH